MDGPAALAALATLAVRLWFWSGFAATPLFTAVEGGHDRALYHAAAQAVAEGAWWPDGSFGYLPLYPWALGLAYRLFGTSLQVAAGLGLGLETLTAFLLVKLARRLGASTPWASAAALAYALYPRAIVYATLTMPTALNVTLVTALAVALAGPGPRTSRAAAGTGLLAGLTGLGYPAVWPALILVAAGRWFGSRYPARRSAVWMLLSALLTALPVVAHNTRAEGQLTLLTTHGGINLYMGNHERATGYPLRIRHFRLTAQEMLEDAHHAAEQETGQTLTRAESSAWWAGQTRHFLRTQPGAALRLTARKMVLFFSRAEMDDLRMLEQVRLMHHQLTGSWWMSYGCFSALGLFGLLRTRSGTPVRILFWTCFASIIALFITTRYRLPLVPLLGAFGAAGLTRLVQDVRARQPVTGHALALLGAILLALWAPPPVDARATDHYNASVQWLAAGRYTEALASARAGLALDPANADLYHAEGSALFKREDYPAAIRAFTRALDLQPDHPRARFNLALSLARAGQPCEALRALEKEPAPGPREQSLMETLRGLCAQP